MKNFRNLILAAAMALSTPLAAVADSDFHDFAPTPPMGWNSWDCYGPSVKEQQVYKNANYMCTHGMLERGWNYVVVDIRWYTNDTGFWYNTSTVKYTLDDYGRYMPNTARFPSSANGVGFKALADSLHRLGLKFGIHIMRGVPREAVTKKMPIAGSAYRCDQITNSKDSTCTWLKDNIGVDCTKPGAQDYYNSLLNLYASWGVDFIKVDDLSRPYHDGEIWLLRNAIDQCGRPIVLSISPGQTPLAKWESCQQNVNMWRMMDDLWDSWSDVMKEFALAAQWNPYRIDGSYPDCDILPFGRIRITNNDARNSRLTRDEQTTVMTLWTIFRSPLFFGGDLNYNDAWTNELVNNEEAIYVNQHSTDNREVSNNGSSIVWAARDSKSDVHYAALFNVGSSDQWIRYNEALFTSETISLLTDGYGTDVECDIPDSATQLALVVDDSGDGYSYDHGDWINPVLVMDDGSERELTRNDMIREDYSGSFFKRINYDKNIEGGSLKVNGKAYAKGWSCNANAMVLYKLPQGARRFKAFAGIDDTGRLQTGATTTLKFLVFAGDPTRRDVCNPAFAVANSGLVSRTYQQQGVSLEADITGAKNLWLVTTNAGDGFDYDHADWINPTLVDEDGKELKLTSIKYDSSKTDWYDISNYGKNVDGGALSVGGTTYADGIGTNTNSVIKYTLPEGRAWKKFKAFVGFDDGVKSAPKGVTMEFQVYTSEPMGSDSIAIPLDLRKLGIAEGTACSIYDIWQKKELGTYSDDAFRPQIVNHGCGYYKITPLGATAIKGVEAVPGSSSAGNAVAGHKALDGVYSISGTLVGRDTQSVPKGLHIVSKGGKARKVVR